MMGAEATGPTRCMNQELKMNFTTEEVGDSTVITVAVERLDATVAPELKNLVTDLVGVSKNRILLDFQHVGFMDSSGLGAVVSGLKAVGEEGEFVVCGMSGVVLDLFKLTHMDRVFEIREDRDDGIQALAA